MGVRFKLIVPLVALALLVLLGLKLLMLPRIFDTQLEAYLDAEQNSVEMLGGVLIHPMRNSDLAQVYSILDSVKHDHPSWYEIVLWDGEGVRIYPLGDEASAKDTDTEMLQHDLAFFGIPVGRLAVSLDVSPVRAKYEQHAQQVDVLIIVLLLLASMVSIFFLEKLVTNPIRSLASAAGKMAVGDFSAGLPRAGRDEVGQLIRSFQGMREEVNRHQDSLHKLAHHDALTGLPNRLMFMDRLEHAIAHAHRSAKPIGVMMLDVDNFKAINDTLGHAAGDALIVSVARRLVSIMREGDTIARLGGDEFMVIVETMEHEDESVAAAERVVSAFASPMSTGEHDIPITVSVGVTTYPKEATELSSLMQNADIAMYRAKSAGGGTYRLYGAETKDTSKSGLEMRSKLYYALERDQYFLEYQPRVNLLTGRVSCAEALIRWRPEGDTRVQPNDFVPLLEQTGLIVDVGEWVIHEGCRFIRQQMEAGEDIVRVSVNLSARQFRDPQLVTKIRRALQEHGVPARYLELELTEGLVMENTQAAIKVLDALHVLGIRLSIDDFGTGYSSLSYLKRFPVDLLKIDRSFIADLPDDKDDAAIVRTIIALAGNLGMGTVAEGVETEQQREFLVCEGCDVLQGYLYSPPLPAQELLAWVAAYNARQLAAAQTG